MPNNRAHDGLVSRAGFSVEQDSAHVADGSSTYASADAFTIVSQLKTYVPRVAAFFHCRSSHGQVFTPSAKPNLAMRWIDSDVLLSSTVRDLCGRLHSARLVPLDCPILVVEVTNCTLKTTHSGDGSQYTLLEAFNKCACALRSSKVP